jgi:hypothetical protein
MRLVRESLNEMNFQKKRDPFSALGIGKIQVIKDWLNEMGVEDYTINDNLTIDVKDNTGLSFFKKGLTKFPDFIQFNEISGSFICKKNNLTSLKGCPTKIYNGDFSCSQNRLTTLEYCPKYVSGDFWCHSNRANFTEEYVRNMCDVKGNIILFNPF